MSAGKKIVKVTAQDRKRHHEIEKRIEKEGVQLDHPQGKEQFEKVLKRAKKKGK